MTPARTHELFSTVAPYLITSLLTIVTGLLSVLLFFVTEKNTELVEIGNSVEVIETKIAVMEGNRFTASDGQDVWREIATMRTDMVAIESTIPKEVPPKWFQDNVAVMGETVNENSRKLDVIDKSVGRMEIQLNSILK